MVQCPGDINNDGLTDIAVVTPDGRAWVKDLSGSLVSQFSLSDINSPADVELMADTNGNGAPELVALGMASAEVWDTLSGSQVSVVEFDSTTNALDLELIPDQGGNAFPKLASLSSAPAQVDVNDGLAAGVINSLSFSNYVKPKDLEIYPDSNGNGSPELAVLGDNTDPAKADKLEIRDLASGEVVRNIWLASGWQVLQQEPLGDHNGNEAEEIAILRVNKSDGQVNVLIRDSHSRDWLGELNFDPEYQPKQLLSIADVNGNGADEVVVFGRRADGRQRAEVRDSHSGAVIQILYFDKNAVAQDITTCADINGNGSEEIVLLGRKASDGTLKAIIKDAKTGEWLGMVRF